MRDAFRFPVAARLVAAAGLVGCGSPSSSGSPDGGVVADGFLTDGPVAADYGNGLGDALPALDGPAAALACDDTLKTAYQAPDTTVLLVHAFAAGERLALANTPLDMGTTAKSDVCLVKLLVGPGNPGPGVPCPSSCPGPSCPTCVPSTSPGIGIEVWLPKPESWNQHIHNLGGAHWAGGDQADPTLIGATGAAAVAGFEGAVSGTTDTGHAIQDGSFAMNPDGSINTALWTDFAYRSLHQLAVQTKALAAVYYGSPATLSYWDGCSTGGRQGYDIAQTYPTDYNGYLIGAPAINWTRFETGELYGQIVIQQDLATHHPPLTTAQEIKVSLAAVKACGVIANQDLGYVLDPLQCAYDPSTDNTVLCPTNNPPPDCVDVTQATAINKFWYGQTTDGSVPSPAIDNGTGAALAANQLWYGQTRGTDLKARINPGIPYPYSTDMVALELESSAIAEPTFMNATGDGANLWTMLSYASFANAANQGIALQTSFGNINSDNPDLTGIKNSGAKIIHYHGLADQLITPLGSIRYYTTMSKNMGGIAATQEFDRMYLIPGMAHCSGSGTVENAGATDGNLPLPGDGQLFLKLTDWVEKGNAPGAIVLQSMDKNASRPICVYPLKASYIGPNPAASTDLKLATNYKCQ